MMKLFMSLSIITLSIFMLFINHPMAMGLLILLQTLLTCLIVGSLINSYWFSYILFLIFLGGLLVLFMYMSSVASNELLYFSLLKKTMIFYSFVFIFFIIYMFKNNLTWLNFSFNEDMNNFFNMFLFSFNENNISLFKLYNKQTYYLMIIMIIYLFITLIAVVKITNIYFGPLRTFQ